MLQFELPQDSYRLRFFRSKVCLCTKKKVTIYASVLEVSAKKLTPNRISVHLGGVTSRFKIPLTSKTERSAKNNPVFY